MCSYIINNYPYEVEYSGEEIFTGIKNGVHRIGKDGEIISLESEIIRKLINRTMGITNCLKKSINSMAYAFLKNENMVK